MLIRHRKGWLWSPRQPKVIDLTGLPAAPEPPAARDWTPGLIETVASLTMGAAVGVIGAYAVALLIYAAAWALGAVR